MARNKNCISVTSMEELMELINHNSYLLDKRTKKLARGNRNIKILCAITIGCAVYASVNCRKLEEQVYQQSVKINNLEYGKGE